MHGFKPNHACPSLTPLTIPSLSSLREHRSPRLKSLRHTGLLALLTILSASPVLAAVNAVPTFHSLGLYWSDSGGSAETICEVQFRKVGTAPWRTGHPLWFDPRTIGAGTDAARPANEYRGSLVNLEPGTDYEIQLSLRGTKTTTALTAATWSESFPIAKTVVLPAKSDRTLVIAESGSPAGYILYTSAPGTTAMIDVAGAQPYNVQIKASYVIVRGLTLVNAGQDAVRIEDNLHDIVVEECDIFGWGRLDTDAGVMGPTSVLWGMYGDGGVYSNSKTLTRLIIQRNRIHDPRTDTNNWNQNRVKYPNNGGHPRGPIPIYIINSAGHLVVRYNDIWSDEDHMFNDIVSGDANFSFRGFPNRDSDIYSNRLSHCWDDAIEAEGGNCNVRIWGNYMSNTFTGVATAATSIGPIYIWRNVYDISRRSEGAGDAGGRGPFAKLGDSAGFGGGRRYYYHNTILQRPPSPGATRAQGASGALSGGGGRNNDRPIVETWTRNNIWHLDRAQSTTYYGNPLSHDNNLDYDLTNGGEQMRGTNNLIGSHMIKGVPSYAPDHGPDSRDGGKYVLAPGTPGFDAAELIPNFNDDFKGTGPDIGAHEAGTPPMEFGVNAYRRPTSAAKP